MTHNVWLGRKEKRIGGLSKQVFFGSPTFLLSNFVLSLLSRGSFGAEAERVGRVIFYRSLSPP